MTGSRGKMSVDGIYRIAVLRDSIFNSAEAGIAILWEPCSGGQTRSNEIDGRKINFNDGQISRGCDEFYCQAACNKGERRRTILLGPPSTVASGRTTMQTEIIDVAISHVKILQRYRSVAGMKKRHEYNTFSRKKLLMYVFDGK